MLSDLDPHWEWIDVTSVEKRPETEFVRAYCRHLEVVPVGTAGESVCLTCETSIPAGA